MSSASSSKHHLIPVDSMASEADRVVINVGGVRYETCKSTLMSIPDTRLANLISGTSGGGPTSEFFFDRDSGAFGQIMNYYRTGKLHCPSDVCGPLFEEELRFWGISEADVEACCWTNFQQHRDVEEALAQLEPDVGNEGMQTRPKVCMSKLWALLDDPHSSVAAMIIGLISLIFILVSIVVFCIGSQPEYPNMSQSLFFDVEYEYSDGQYFVTEYKTNTILIVEIICVIWFTIEFLIRIICCPNKKKFVTNILNIIDFVALLPFYVEVDRRGMLSETSMFFLGCLRAARCIRLLRIFKIARRATAIQALGYSLRASVYDFCLLGFIISVAILVFSILIYCAESSNNSKFTSMSGALWWAVITVTTVGYGDAVPLTWLGKVIASLCALTGILAITMPIPILVTKFAKFYALTEAKQRRLAKRRRGDGTHSNVRRPVEETKSCTEAV